MSGLIRRWPRPAARLDRWWRHRVWHAQYPELYWRTNGNQGDPNDFIRCPFCHKEYRAMGSNTGSEAG